MLRIGIGFRVGTEIGNRLSDSCYRKLLSAGLTFSLSGRYFFGVLSILNEGPEMSNGVNNMEANFSTLILSIGSSAAMALGLAPNPMSGEMEKDLNLARFNIDLLRMLKDKTKGNLSADEQKFLESIVTDLQMKFVTAK